MIYGIILDVKVSEYVICMIVMKNVIDNVIEFIDDLLLEYNRVR